MTVSPTTLVHEAYVNLAGREGTRFADPATRRPPDRHGLVR